MIQAQFDKKYIAMLLLEAICIDNNFPDNVQKNVLIMVPEFLFIEIDGHLRFTFAVGIDFYFKSIFYVLVILNFFHKMVIFKPLDTISYAITFLSFSNLFSFIDRLGFCCGKTL